MLSCLLVIIFRFAAWSCLDVELSLVEDKFTLAMFFVMIDLNIVLISWALGHCNLHLKYRIRGHSFFF